MAAFVLLAMVVFSPAAVVVVIAALSG